MIIEKIGLRGFMRHRDSQIELPPNGIVLVTGPNGGGKSSLVEAVATGLWNETLRGTPPWSGDKGDVEILTDTILANRLNRSNRRSLKWQDRIGDPIDYENPTKAQQALEELIGTFQLWRRTSVFSSSDATHFTLASDGERKRLLEAVLGLEKFDPALDACRLDKRQAENEVMKVESALASLTATLTSSRARLADAQTILNAAPKAIDREDIARRIALAEKVVEGHGSALREYDARRYKLDDVVTGAAADLRSAERTLASLGTGVCGACGQDLPKKIDRTPAVQAVAEAKAAHAAAKKALDDMVAETRQDYSEIVEEQRTALNAVHRLRAELAQADSVDRQRAAASGALDAARAAVTQAEQQIEAKTSEGKKLKASLACLGVVEQVLGLKGVRAHVLGTALSGIEEVANSWLARLDYTHMRVKLNPYTEKKTGGISDAIALEVEGAGGGHGYKGASAGERRRIDIAMLFALAEVAEAAHGATGGSLFVDEAFDGLDEGGVQAVRDVLADLAAERQIVLITHNPLIINSLPAVKRLRVEMGTVQAA